MLPESFNDRVKLFYKPTRDMLFLELMKFKNLTIKLEFRNYKNLRSFFITKRTQRIFMLLLILIISYILIFEWNFELVFKLRHWRGPPYVDETFALLFTFFLYLPLIIFNVKIKKIWPYAKITKWIKILWILGQYNSRHVIKHVTLYRQHNIFIQHKHVFLAFWRLFCGHKVCHLSPRA